MAVAYDNDTGAVVSSGTTPISVTHTAGGANRAAFVGTYMGAISGTVTAITTTYAGNAADGELWDQDNSFANNRTNGAYFKEAKVPASAQTVSSARVGTSTNMLKAMCCVSLTGVDQTTSVGTPQMSFATTGTTPSVTVTGTVAGGLLVDWFFCSFASGTPAAGANQTEQFKDTATQAGFCAGSSTQSSADGGVMSWSKVSNFEYFIGAVEFKPAAAVAGHPTMRRWGGVPGMMPGGSMGRTW